MNRNGVYLAILNGFSDNQDPFRASFRLIVIAHVCFLVSAIWILIDRPFDNSKITRWILFGLLIIGALFQITYCIQSTVKECAKDSDIYGWDSEIYTSNGIVDKYIPDPFATSEECKLQHITFSLFMSMMSTFIAFDVLMVNGLNIKARIMYLSLIIAIFSALRSGELFKVYSDWLVDDATVVVYCYISIAVAYGTSCLSCLFVICNGLQYLRCSKVSKQLLAFFILIVTGITFSALWIDFYYSKRPEVDSDTTTYYVQQDLQVADNRDLKVYYILIPAVLFMIYDFICSDDEYAEKAHKINANDATTRSTFWYIIYLIISVAEVNTYIAALIFATTKEVPWYISSVHVEIDDIRANYLTMISAHSMVIISSCSILLNHVGNGQTRILVYIGSCLSIFAALIIFGTSFQGMSVFCIKQKESQDSNYYWWLDYDDRNCRMSYMNCIILYVGFLIYLAIDNIYKLGDKISNRILITSGLLSIFGIMNGWTSLNLYYVNYVDDGSAGDADHTKSVHKGEGYGPYFDIDWPLNALVGLYFYFMGSLCLLVFIAYCIRMRSGVRIIKQLEVFMPYALILCGIRIIWTHIPRPLCVIKINP